MESIDCALELGYDPVKVSFSWCTDCISTGRSEKIQKKGDGWVAGCLSAKQIW